MKHGRRSSSRGFVLPAVLLFLAAAFAMWAVLFRGSSNVLRIEEARSHRDARATWTAPALAQGLRLLETGTPPTDPYVCKVTLTQAGQTEYFLLTFTQLTPTKYTVQCIATDSDSIEPDIPASF